MQRTLQKSAVHSPTLAINEEIARLRASGADILNLGFGEAGLPVLPEILEVFRDAAELNGYAPTAGSLAARRAVAEQFTRERALPTSADQIVLAPGSKALLYALLSVLPGDVVLPRPSWVSYAAQARFAGRRVIWVDIPPHAGGVPDPAVFAQTLSRARADGADPGILVLTCPDNPTGTLADPATVTAVCAVAAEAGLAVISDEIYRDLVHRDDTEFLSAAEVIPELTYVTSGLSKSLALGGWRTGFLRVPATAEGDQVRSRVIGLASEVWSSVPAPLEPVIEYAVSGAAPVAERIHASRALHGAVASAVHSRLIEAGVACRPPDAGFYLYPDFEPLRERLAGLGLRTGPDLAGYLLSEFGIGSLPGSAFGDDDGALRLRLATSLLYGATPQARLAALHSADPVSCPEVAANLTRIELALARLAGASQVPHPVG